MSATFPLADLVVRIVGDMSQFSREMVRTESLLKKKASAFTAIEKQGTAVFSTLGRAVGGFGAVLATSLTAGLGALAALVGGLAAFSVWATKVSISATEMRNRFKVTFGQAAKQSEADLDSFADSVGRSRIELMDMASTLQNVFTAMGFTQNQSAKLSVTVAKLGTDIASFHDIADSDAVDRLSSALVGNHEALRSLGIVVTETAVKQQLLAMGFKRGFDSATDQEKMLARLAIILRATSLMQNDAGRTAGTAANQFKGLWGAVKDLADLWGQALQPALTIIVSGLREFALAARDNAGSLTQLSQILAGWANSVVSIFSEIAFVVGNYDLSWQALVMTVQKSTEGITNYIAGFATGAFAILEWLGTNWQTIWQNTLDNMTGMFTGFVSDVQFNLQGLWDFIKSGGTKFQVKTSGVADAVNNIMEGTTDFTVPKVDTTDWDEKWRKLEDEFNKRRAARGDKSKKGFEPFMAPELQGMFDQLNGAGKKAEIKVTMSDSLSAWKENLMDAFKNTDVQKQTKLQQDIADNQKKQMEQDKQMNSETLKALAHVGGGFY